MNNGFIPYMHMGINQPMQFDPYQDKVNRYNMLQNQVQQTSSSNNNPFLTVANMQEAKEKVLAYNSVCWMRDSSEPYIYIKSVDTTGTPNFTVLKLEDVTNQINNNKASEVQLNNNYVSIEQYENLLQEVQNIKAQLGYYNLANSSNCQTIIDAEPKDTKKGFIPTKKVGDK